MSVDPVEAKIDESIRLLNEALGYDQENAPPRERIANMSAEVVDTNPYRLVTSIFYKLQSNFNFIVVV